MGAECDIDDPFAMMGGMGEEEVYKVTLMEDKTTEEAAAESKENIVSEGVRQADEKTPRAPGTSMLEEDAVECDCDDPFAMMGGMGEEEVYKVTLMEDKVAEEHGVVHRKTVVSEAVKRIEEKISQASSSPTKRKKKNRS